MANAFHFFSRLITIATENYFLLLFHYYLLYLPVVAAADVKIVSPSIINLKYEKATVKEEEANIVVRRFEWEMRLDGSRLQCERVS